MIPVALSTIDNDYERDFMIKIYNKYYSVSKNKAFAILHDLDDAEEVVQDAFIKLIEHLPKIMKLNEEHVSAYIIVTVKNSAIDNFRKRNRESNKRFSFDEDEAIRTLVDPKPLPEDLYQKQEELEELAAALKLLPEKDRILLESKYILGQSDVEIGEALGISEKSVRMYLTRARRQAYELLKGGVAHGTK